jgi:hypothetical protein
MHTMRLRNVGLSLNYKALEFRKRTLHGYRRESLKSNKNFHKFSRRTNSLDGFSSLEGSCFHAFHFAHPQDKWGERSSVVVWGTIAGSIPDGVIGFFNWPNPSSRTMARGSTQPLTEMSTRNLPLGGGGVKGGRHVRLTISPPSVSRLSGENVGASTCHNPMGLLRLVTGIALPLPSGQVAWVFNCELLPNIIL